MCTKRGLFLFLLLIACSFVAFGQNYRLLSSTKIGGAGGWDYLAADSGNRRLYVSHGTQVEVLDLDTGKLIGKITGMQRIHGIAIADDLGRGFISDGGSNNVVVFDLKNRSVLKKAAAGTNPDGIVYDSFTKRVFAFNGRSQNATVIDAKTGNVVGAIALGGKPEFPVSDGQGHIYDNLEDKSQILKINSRTLEVEARWSISPGESPSGLAIDTARRRLFSVCDNKMMVVVDADSGRIVATPTIGEGPDAAGYDPDKKLAFSSNGQDGTLTVISESGGSYSVLQNVTTAKGARTMAIDLQTHKIYLSDAEFGPAPAATAEHPHPRPTILPGTFKLLVVGE